MPDIKSRLVAKDMSDLTIKEIEDIYNKKRKILNSKI